MKQDIKINEHHTTEPSVKELLEQISETTRRAVDLSIGNSNRIIQLEKTVSILTNGLIGSALLFILTLTLNYIL